MGNHLFRDDYPLKVWMFHYHVKLPEGTTKWQLEATQGPIHPIPTSGCLQVLQWANPKDLVQFLGSIVGQYPHLQACQSID